MKISEKQKKDSSEGFGLRFRLLMGYHNLTLKDIALATNNAVSTISTWKNGRIPSSPLTIDRLAEQFKVTPSYLLYGHQDSCPVENKPESVLPPAEEEEKSNDKKEEAILSSQEILAQKINTHLQAYLQEALSVPYVLEHMWIQIQRDFPLLKPIASQEIAV